MSKPGEEECGNERQRDRQTRRQTDRRKKKDGRQSNLKFVVVMRHVCEQGETGEDDMQSCSLLSELAKAKGRTRTREIVNREQTHEGSGGGSNVAF